MKLHVSMADLSFLKSENNGELRFTPKRINSKYISKNFPELWKILQEQFPSDYPLQVKLSLYEKDLRVLPKCKVCRKKEVSYKSFFLYDTCSNSCSIKSKAVQEKTKKTCLSRYGTRRKWGPRKTYEIGTHHGQRHLKNLSDIHDKPLIESILETGWVNVAKHFGLTTKSHSSTFKFLRKIGIDPLIGSHGTSNIELSIREFISGLDEEVIHRTRKMISPFEIDLFVKRKNIGFEINGNYYHSFSGIETKKEREKHLTKTELMEAKGLNLIHIFESDWILHREKVESLIRSKLGKSQWKIPGRKCEVKLISSKEANLFCLENHMQGPAPASISIGLDYHGQLVAVMTFSKSRFDKKYEFELIRTCSKLDTLVHGGFSKMLSFFEKTFSPKSIISYGNRRWCSSLNNVYLEAGFTFIGKTSPNYFYIKGLETYSRMKCQKHKLKNLIPEFYDPLKTEAQMMFDAKFRRMWDSGNLKYVKEYL